MANFLIIRNLAESKNITLRKIANSAGIGEAALQALIQKGSTNTTTLEKIAQVLEVPVGVFFDDTPVRNITQKGNGNVIGNQNKVTFSEYENKLEIANNEIAHLRELLEEKERTIQILIKK